MDREAPFLPSRNEAPTHCRWSDGVCHPHGHPCGSAGGSCSWLWLCTGGSGQPSWSWAVGRHWDRLWLHSTGCRQGTQGGLPTSLLSEWLEQSVKPDTASWTPGLATLGFFSSFSLRGSGVKIPGWIPSLFLGLLKGSSVTSIRKNSTVHILCVVISSFTESAETAEAHGRHVSYTHAHSHTPLNFKPTLQKVNDVWAKVIYDSVDLSHFHQEMWRQPVVPKKSSFSHVVNRLLCN